MSEQTNIEWADHTGGPFLGCTEVSPGCVNCYARELAEKRLAPMIREAYRKSGLADWETRPIWGKTAPRVLTKGFWKEAVRLDKAAGNAGQRRRMFPSMIDWLDDMPAGIMDQDGKWLNVNAVVADFLKLIHDTPNLDWLLLTKRPGNWRDRLSAVMCFWGVHGGGEASDMVSAWLFEDKPPANVWIGTSVEDQTRADERIPQLLKIPAKVRFLSVEPMLGQIEFSDVTRRTDAVAQLGKPALDGIHWAIFGGESGNGARPCNIEWIRSGVEQCQAAGVAAFVKQLGAKPFMNGVSGLGSSDGDQYWHPLRLTHPKGGDMAEWPEDLRVRKFPKVTA